MSKINLLTLIKSLEDKFNSYQKNIQSTSIDVSADTNAPDAPESSPTPSPVPSPVPTPTPTPVPTPTPSQTPKPTPAPANSAPVSVTPIKTGGAPIGKIKISTVLLFEKVDNDMKLISHFKVEDDNIEDVSIMEKFNIDYTENKESVKIENKIVKKRSSFFGRNR